ncbi:AI-2E family transporter [Desulfosporosinus sp. FKA]|uniref:AI-2E family transporter n=1 Tax=Desulfosporosinus sp. FKA TaxID=1969834 RepID=UPI001FA902A0|nr:AI-2E family transporter [Desulfosporosinus sp. FKA]
MEKNKYQCQNLKVNVNSELPDIYKRIISLCIFILVIIGLKSMMNLFLFTFIFTYIFYHVREFIYRRVNKFLQLPKVMVTIFVYLVFAALILFSLFKYIPLLTTQVTILIDQITNFNVTNYQYELDSRLVDLIKMVNIESYLKEGGDYFLQAMTNIGKFSLNLFLAFILSLFCMLGKKEIFDFGRKLEFSKISFLYAYFRYFGSNFLNSFGKVLRLQILIAFINAVLSFIILFFLGFPQVLGLSFMIFILGLIPVAGVIISLIPLGIIAFTIGGLTKVVYVLVMIAALHALESYVLNPQLAATKMKLPIFFTFMILIIGEHFFGIWGLLIGIPLFMFLLDLVEVRV